LPFLLSVTHTCLHYTQAPNGALASTFHLVNALVRVRLLSEKGTHCVRFLRDGRATSYLMTEVGMEARRQVARSLTSETIRKLQKAPSSDSRDFALMQELSDAGFGQCPLSGVPIFDPARCSPEKLDAIWRVYCSLAKSTTDRSQEAAEEASDALDALKSHWSDRAS
jgi:hypothetical protein